MNGTKQKCYRNIELFGDVSRLPYHDQYFYKIPCHISCNLHCIGGDEALNEGVDSCSLFTLLPSTEISWEAKGLSVVSFSEEPQSFAEWKYFMSKLKLSSWSQFQRSRKTVVSILPIGPFPNEMKCFDMRPSPTSDSEQHPSLFTILKNFGAVFLPGITFELLPSIDYLDIKSLNTRHHSVTGQFQLLIGDVMEYLLQRKPNKSLSIIAVSWFDFYPCDEMNHILGEGNAQSGCAAISFGHYGKQTQQLTVEQQHDDLPLYETELSSLPLYETELSSHLLLQVIKAFCHELCHTLGLSHCQFFICCMNASPTIAAIETQPLTMCPVCLRKLQYKLGFTIMPRYNAIRQSLMDIISWIQNNYILKDKRKPNRCQENSPLLAVVKRLQYLSDITIECHPD